MAMVAIERVEAQQRNNEKFEKTFAKKSVGKALSESMQEFFRDIGISKLEEELTKELYEDIPTTKIATLIKENHNVKVTDKLIESYIELASSKLFTADPVVQGIRTMNSFDNLVEGKIDYVLNDGCIVAIDEDTNSAINNLLVNKSDIVHYMRESKENFMHIVKEIS